MEEQMIRISTNEGIWNETMSIDNEINDND